MGEAAEDPASETDTDPRARRMEVTERIPSAAWDPFLDIASGDPWQLRTSEKRV